MTRWLRAATALAWLLPIAPDAWAGADCEVHAPSPASIAAAADTALQVRDALERQDRPLALLARVGTDLSQYGLVYSHVGVVLRDHLDGRWTVLHLLNRCGTDRSALYAEGLVNFFADGLVSQDARIVWLTPMASDALLARVGEDVLHSLHQPHYSVIARPGSDRYQNSTAWVLEWLAAAQLPAGDIARPRAQAAAVASGHTPDRVRIGYGKRVLGGLFGANLAFTDHPVGTRLSGDYPVVTVRSILRWLRARGVIAHEAEWRDGRWQPMIGPA